MLLRAERLLALDPANVDRVVGLLRSLSVFERGRPDLDMEPVRQRFAELAGQMVASA